MMGWQVMSKEHAEEKRDLIRAILKDRKHMNLPKIAQVLYKLGLVFF